MADILEKNGRTFDRVGPDGGWLERGASLPKGSTATITGDAVVFKEAAANMHGGTFHAGTFIGGGFHAGKFIAGVFLGGWFYGGTFYGGTFHAGTFHAGKFLGGWFYGGKFHGGKFHKSPSCAMRADGHMFVAKIVDGELRIWAGCRNFSWGEAVAHWNDDHPYGAESQRIIHFLKEQEEAQQ